VAELGGEAVREGADREGVDRVEVLPESGLVLGGGEAGRTREGLAVEEEGVDRDVAGDLEVLLLAESDKDDVVLALDVGDVNAAAVETGEQENRGEVGRLGVGDDGLVERPSGKVSRDL
jgi:hypothetical protein